MTTQDHERKIKIDQQEVVDHLWLQFLEAGYYDDEKGFDLEKIPEKLHANWGKSCLADDRNVDRSAVGNPTAADQQMYVGIEVMAQPVSPPPPGYRERSVSTSASVGRSTRYAAPQYVIGAKRQRDPVSQSKSRSPAPTWNRQPASSSSSSWQKDWNADNRN